MNGLFSMFYELNAENGFRSCSLIILLCSSNRLYRSRKLWVSGRCLYVGCSNLNGFVSRCLPRLNGLLKSNVLRGYPPDGAPPNRFDDPSRFWPLLLMFKMEFFYSISSSISSCLVAFSSSKCLIHVLGRCRVLKVFLGLDILQFLHSTSMDLHSIS